MESRYDYDIIRDYLHGLVDREKALEIGELIRNDDVARDIAEGILRLETEFNNDEENIDTYLENFRQAQLARIQVHATAVKNRKRSNQWLKIAAAFLLLVVAVFAIQRMTAKPDAISLIDEDLSQPYPVSNVFRSPANESDYNKAVELYRHRNYVQASLYFEKAAENGNDLATITFYGGLSALYSGHYNRAIKLLDSQTISASRYAQQAQWYMCLAFLKSEQKEKGVELLHRINNTPQHYKSESAAQLLEALE